MTTDNAPVVAIVMGSKSDWDTMEPAADILTEFGVPYECRVLSAHRTPAQLTEYMNDVEARGCKVFIGGAGGAAHLPGVIASQTLKPVLGVPVDSALRGLDSLLSIVQMPAGIPVGTLAVGKSGAVNAALLAVAILAIHCPEMNDKLQRYREKKAQQVIQQDLPQRQTKAGFIKE